jgi:hypothetical protein
LDLHNQNITGAKVTKLTYRRQDVRMEVIVTSRAEELPAHHPARQETEQAEDVPKDPKIQ